MQCFSRIWETCTFTTSSIRCVHKLFPFLPGLPENHLCTTVQKSRTEMIKLFKNKIIQACLKLRCNAWERCLDSDHLRTITYSFVVVFVFF